MATNITSQITSREIVRSTSPERTAVASNRQTPAAGGNILPANTAVQAVQPDQVSTQVPTARLEQAVSDINTYVQSINRELQFRLDEGLPLGRAVIKVIDAETDETIREIPSEEVLALAKAISEQLESEAKTVDGFLIQAKA